MESEGVLLYPYPLPGSPCNENRTQQSGRDCGCFSQRFSRRRVGYLQRMWAEWTRKSGNLSEAATWSEWVEQVLKKKKETGAKAAVTYHLKSIWRRGREGGREGGKVVVGVSGFGNHCITFLQGKAGKVENRVYMVWLWHLSGRNACTEMFSRKYMWRWDVDAASHFSEIIAAPDMKIWFPLPSFQVRIFSRKAWDLQMPHIDFKVGMLMIILIIDLSRTDHFLAFCNVQVQVQMLAG